MKNDFFIQINSEKFSGFETVRVQKDMTSVVDEFLITYSVRETNDSSRRNPVNLIRAQDDIQIFIDDNKILTGFIDSLSTSYDTESRVVNIQGFSKTIDLVESDILGDTYSIEDLETLTQEIFKNNNITDINIINNLGSLPIKVKNDVFGGFYDFKSPKESNKIKQITKIFDYLDKYANQAKVLLRTDKDGNLVFEREEQIVTIGNLLSLKNNSNNNIKSASYGASVSSFFRNNDLFTEEKNDSFTGGALTPNGSYIDILARPGRRIRTQKNFVEESPNLNEIAKWEANIRRSQAMNYACTVQGYYNDEKSQSLWEPNKLVKVNDDKCLVEGQFLIKGVTYDKSVDNGSTTTLDIVNRGTFNLDPDLQIKNKEENDFGSRWIKTDF